MTSAPASDELVHLDISAGIATITLDSPHNRNALSAQLRRELGAHLITAIEAPDARVIVLTHTGTVFCAGMDLREARGDGLRGTDEMPALFERIWTSPTPVIARLAGPARAGGVGLVAACDLAIAAEDVSFAFTEVRIGVVPALISVTVLPRLAPAAAHELFLTGEKFDARRAESIGLLTRAVPATSLDDEVGRYAEMLRLGAPNALAATKKLLRGATAATMGEDLAAMLELSARHFASDEGQEGIRAFGEKRPPSWTA